MFGGTRRGPTGRDESDCVHKWLAMEIKVRKDTPAYIREWMAQAEANAGPGQLPLVVWHKVGDLYANALVCMRAIDFLDWFGDTSTPPVAQVAAALGGEEEELPFTDVGVG